MGKYTFSFHISLECLIISYSLVLGISDLEKITIPTIMIIKTTSTLFLFLKFSITPNLRTHSSPCLHQIHRRTSFHRMPAHPHKPINNLGLGDRTQLALLDGSHCNVVDFLKQLFKLGTLPVFGLFLVELCYWHFVLQDFYLETNFEEKVW